MNKRPIILFSLFYLNLDGKLGGNRAVIAFGANLGEREQTIERALSLIAESIGPIIKRSSILETAPLVLPGADPSLVPPYLNGVVLVESELVSEQILAKLLNIERRLGRDRAAETSRWMSRVIDLDLICVEQEVCSSLILKLPHPEMHKRDFVLLPMEEVWPEWIHPRLNLTVRDLIAALKQG